MGGAVIPGVLGNGINTSDKPCCCGYGGIRPGPLPLVCGMGNGSVRAYSKGFVQKQVLSGLFLPCGGLFFQAVKHFPVLRRRFPPAGKEVSAKGRTLPFPEKIGPCRFQT